MDEEPTCGRGLAQNADLPEALGGVAAGLAENLEVHVRALDGADAAAAREREVYERVARSLRGAAADLRAAATEMASAIDLPMGAHDMAELTTTDTLDAFESFVAAGEHLRRLLVERRAEDEQMLAAIHAETGAPARTD